MRYYGFKKDEILNMSFPELQGWLALIPDTAKRLGEGKLEITKGIGM